MATTETRSGFRLPWSSDRSRDESQTDAQSDGKPADDETAAKAVVPEPDLTDGSDLADGTEAVAEEAWPEIDVNARLHRLGADAEGSDPSMSPAHTPEEPARMAETAAAPVPAPAAAPRKPSKLIADLAAAMRATAETAREQSLSQVEAEAREVVEQIRARSTDGTAGLRQQSDDDIAAIRDWSKAEIAHIREETDRRISARKATLEEEIAAHAAAIERHVEQVQGTVAAYETEMAEFFERLLGESDPARLAAMAESMPEPPSLALWEDSPDLDLKAPRTEAETEPDTDEPALAQPETEAIGDTEILGTVEDINATTTDGLEPEASVEVEAVAEPEATVEVEVEAVAEPEATVEVEVEAVAEPGTVSLTEAGDAWAGTTWGDHEGGWDTRAGAAEDDTTAEAAEDDVPRWADTDAVEGGPNEGGDPVDRGSIMAALEAAAEAVVAAEAAADSADQAEAAADVAETAAELIVGRSDADEHPELDPDTAFAARLDAGGFDDEPSLADRLASLLPGGGATVADATPTTTQVIVTGLVSVASIASFKRHLGRLGGVQSVSVASGPDGEFMFNVTHRADATFRDAISTLPGFGARVTGTGEGVVHVTARDPETEG
jgi:hypothetical protein